MDSIKSIFIVQLLFFTTNCPCILYGQEDFFTPIESEELVTDDGSSRGIAWGDYNNDGYPDIVVANTMNNSNFVYKNDGAGKFVQITEDSIAFSGKWTEGVKWIDVENDGDLDLFISNQWQGPNELYINNGPEKGFHLATETGDLTKAPSNSPCSCWADYDLDGLLDVYIVNRDSQNDELYKNIGAGKFKKISEGIISNNGGDGRSCAWGDIDGDLYPELYVGNFIVRNGEDVLKARNYLYKNLGNGKFQEIETGLPVTNLGVTYGVSFIDYDYDDDLDLFVTNIGRTDTNMLYANDGSGNFKKMNLVITKEMNRPSKGHTWGDFDNDGFLDLFIANGTMNIEPNKIRNMLFLGQENGDFIEIMEWAITLREGTSAGTAWADYDRDGDLDVFVANWANNNENNELYRNETSQRSRSYWLELQFKGTKSNSYGIGTRVKIKTKNKNGNETWQTRYLASNTGYSSQNEPIVHFGLGNNEIIEVLEVHWPSKTVDSYNNLKANQFYTVEEGIAITKK